MADLDTLKAHYVAPSGIDDGTAPLPPTEHEMLHRQTAAPGDPALLPIGIVYQAFWQDAADGTSIHARAQARALSAAGLPVLLQGIDVQGKYLFDQEIEPQVQAEVAHLRRLSFSSTALAIRHVVLSSPRNLEWVICPAGARLASFADQKRVYASTIIYTPWERSTVPKPLVDILNRCAEVWVPCMANVEAMKKAGVERVLCVPCPYDPNGFVSYPVEQAARAERDRVVHLGAPISRAAHIPAPRGSESVPVGKRFYSIGKWEPRKGLHELVGAFLTAFSPSERVSLYLKTWDWRPWKGYPSPDESLRHWVNDAEVRKRWTAEQIQKRVLVVSAKLPIEQLYALHAKNNIYVSASHGEAWDLPAFDAVCAGNSLVHVGYGGSAEYAPPGSPRVFSTFGPVHPDYGWEPEAEWAEYEPGALVQALRDAAPPKRRVHPPDLYGRFGLYRVGSMMRDRILEIAGTIEANLPDRLLQAGGFG